MRGPSAHVQPAHMPALASRGYVVQFKVKYQLSVLAIYAPKPYFKQVNSSAVLGTCRLTFVQFHMLRDYIYKFLCMQHRISLAQNCCSTGGVVLSNSIKTVQPPWWKICADMPQQAHVAAQCERGHSCQLHKRHELPSQPGKEAMDDICQEVPDMAWLPRRSQWPARQRRAASQQEALQTTQQLVCRIAYLQSA